MAVLDELNLKELRKFDKLPAVKMNGHFCSVRVYQFPEDRGDDIKY